MGKREINDTIEVAGIDDHETNSRTLVLSFRFETYTFTPETAKELGEALVAEAEEQLENEGN